jgi:hypothetical protein
MKGRRTVGNKGSAHATFETKNIIFGEIGIKFWGNPIEIR